MTITFLLGNTFSRKTSYRPNNNQTSESIRAGQEEVKQRQKIINYAAYEAYLDGQLSYRELMGHN